MNASFNLAILASKNVIYTPESVHDSSESLADSGESSTDSGESLSDSSESSSHSGESLSDSGESWTDSGEEMTFFDAKIARVNDVFIDSKGFKGVCRLYSTEFGLRNERSFIHLKSKE